MIRSSSPRESSEPMTTSCSCCFSINTGYPAGMGRHWTGGQVRVEASARRDVSAPWKAESLRRPRGLWAFGQGLRVWSAYETGPGKTDQH